jgi:tRNA (guanine-N7-)-methyltransferase
LSKYENIFTDKKVILQRTDNRDLFEFSLVNFNECDYKIVEISLDLHNSTFFDGITTEYEDKFSSKGNPIYYVKVTKD